MSCVSKRPPGHFVWLLGFALVLAVHCVWQFLNEAPPAWDMAFHQLKGWQFLELWKEGRPFQSLWSISFPYPPLYHWIEAVVLGVFGNTKLLAFYANLPGLFLLSYGTYRVGRYYLPPTQAGWTSVLVLLFPMVAWVSRESLLDVPLAGWVTFAGFLVLRSGYLTNRKYVLLLGLACAGGLLTKWTFPVYVAVPILFGLCKSPQRVRSFINLLVAALLALPLVMIYYGPNIADLVSNYPTTEQAGLIPWRPYPRHGEPGLNNYLGWIYYPRVFVSYFLFLPLTLLFLVGALQYPRRTDSGREDNNGFLWFWLVGGIVLLTFVTPKDPRFAIPLVTPLAVLLVRFWQGYPRLLIAMVVVSVVQFLLVSFTLPLTPSKFALLERKGDRDFQTIQREWVFFQPEYSGITGPPRHENWQLSQIIRQIPEDSVVGVLPELPRLNVNALVLQGARTSQKVNAVALGNLEDWRSRLEDLDFVVSKTGDQGLSFITRFNQDIAQKLKSECWGVVGEWPLPDGSVARLMARQDRLKIGQDELE